PGSAYAVSNALWSKGVRNPSQLKGMKIGIPDIGSTPHYIAGMLADKYDWVLGKDIQLVPLGSVMAMKAALYNGSIDWSVFPSNIAHRMQSEKIAHVIGHVGEETPWQASAIMASKSALQEKQNVLRRFLSAYYETVQYYRQLFMASSAKEYAADRDQVAETISRFVLPAVSKKEVLAFPVYLDSHGELDVNSLKKQLEWFKKQGMVSDRVHISDVIAREYVTFLDDKAGE
ncbi:MAG: ABC transporter substrate-binding protein, partial [Endozoicomonas sp.]